MENVETVVRESQVMAQISGLQNALDKVVEQIAAFEGSLQPVLRPSTPESADKSPDSPCDVPLAEEIRMQENRIRKMSCSLADLMERLEV